jgi:geranylgeranylglycerol-phosphate geranylgeranyltransferase
MRKSLNLLSALFTLSRPSNVLIAFITIFVAAELAGGLNPLENVILAAVSASFITIGSNVINDYYDIAIDRINKPFRPLAAGKISNKSAIRFFFILYILAWGVAGIINIQMFFIAFTVGILLFFYSYKLKRTLLWGNLTVSLATAMAFVYGGGAVNHYEETLFPAMFAFFFHFGREILKDIQDLEGDYQAGAKTFPIKFGIDKSLQLVSLVFILVVILTVIPYIFGIYSIKYFMTVCIGIYPVLAFVLYRSWENRTPHNLGQMSNILKADMIVGLLAIYLR